MNADNAKVILWGSHRPVAIERWEAVSITIKHAQLRWMKWYHGTNSKHTAIISISATIATIYKNRRIVDAMNAFDTGELSLHTVKNIYSACYGLHNTAL